MANNDKEIIGRIDYITVRNKNMRRKPQQQIYRPGSGPLRKSVQDDEHEMIIRMKQTHVTDCTLDNKYNKKKLDIHYKNLSSEDNFGNQSESDVKKRPRKPEQALYVPKALLQAKAEKETVHTTHKANISNKNFEFRNTRKSEARNGNIHQNGSLEKLNVKSKRYSANRKQGFDQGEYSLDNNRKFSRNNRQGSEPRSVVPAHLHRVRDTRSVEPSSLGNINYQGEKIQSKPPSGRRHSTICLETNKPHKPPLNLENLPPRLRRKYLADNNIDPSAYPGVLDDIWDGSSVTFKGSDNSIRAPNAFHHNVRSVYHPPVFSNHNLHFNSIPPANWSNTIPNTRIRGRLRTETVDNTIFRSLTPDRILLISPANSRPCTPPPFPKTKSTESLTSTNIRSVTPLAKEVPSSLKNDVNLADAVDNTTKEEEEILDWSEEVELNDKLEAEALSDCMTRCSSVTSLTETTAPPPQQQSPPHKSRRNRRSKQRNRSSSRSQREKSTDNQSKNSMVNHFEVNQNQNINKRNIKQLNDFQQNKEKIDNDGFKVPESRPRRRKNSFRDRSNDRRREKRSQNDSRHSSLDRSRNNSYSERENWRDEIRLRCSSERQVESFNEKIQDAKSKSQPAPGIIILRQQTIKSGPPVLNLPVSSVKHQYSPPRPKPNPGVQKTLFDPSNPNKPIVVTALNSRILSEIQPEPLEICTPSYTTDQFGNVCPNWYDLTTDSFRQSHFPEHLTEVRRADYELQNIIQSGLLLSNWNSEVTIIRNFLKDSLEYLLEKDIKFCQTENVENHYWKITYHNIIELMRKLIVSNPENKEHYKSIILNVIDEGTEYFERLLDMLQVLYKFKLDNHIGMNNSNSSKGLGYVGLALVSAQKIFLFLGDLARYKEKVNDTNNYGKCRQWYIKAHEINPRNGRPYNQLAVLALYARRKLDAVYYYMRSLMSSNPVQSAKESLISLYDENRKRYLQQNSYEQAERKRKEEKAKMKDKESKINYSTKIRREYWFHPDGGDIICRTTKTEDVIDSEEEDLQTMSTVMVNKRFVTSYLHVHGKLITKIGLETFQQTALLMLREFRVLLQQTPVLVTSNRLLHLIALNMYAIDSTQLKDPELELHCRSEVQERALVVSLQMFNLILERCVELLQDHLRLQERHGHDLPLPLCQDLQIILPAVKVWCDWMLCHSSVWNPPPSCSDYRVGSSTDAWSRLATLMNQLEKLEYQKPLLHYVANSENEIVRLPEDATMSGFIPLMCNSQPPVYVNKDVDMESAQMSFRIEKLLFFGTEFLCGIDPPVLKLQRYETYSEYVSVVRNSLSNSPSEFYFGEFVVEDICTSDDKKHFLLKHYDDVERIKDLQTESEVKEYRIKQIQNILDRHDKVVEVEVRPRYLVPDTNCFIDYLDRIQILTGANGSKHFTFMVPLVVLNELEGLSRGIKSEESTSTVKIRNDEHLKQVSDASKRALDFLRCKNPRLKCLTMRGTVLASSTFTSEAEETNVVGPRNDDRILATALSICRENPDVVDYGEEGNPMPRYQRDVVLLTEDRNLRVKASTRYLPVREMPDFLNWARIG